MFVGTYYHTLEGKGRFSLPKVFRSSASNWALTAGLDGCLFVFPAEKFEQETAKLASLSYLKADHRTLVRHFSAHTSVQALDRLGRLSVTEDLRNLINLKQKIVIVGALERIEVWDLKKYHEIFDNLAGTVEKSSEIVEWP
jgi:MraZ protein